MPVLRITVYCKWNPLCHILLNLPYCILTRQSQCLIRSGLALDSSMNRWSNVACGSRLGDIKAIIHTLGVQYNNLLTIHKRCMWLTLTDPPVLAFVYADESHWDRCILIISLISFATFTSNTVFKNPMHCLFLMHRCVISLIRSLRLYDVIKLLYTVGLWC